MIVTLSPRECEIFQLLKTDMTNHMLAEWLGCKEKTVRFHNGNIYRKLGVRSREEFRHFYGDKPLKSEKQIIEEQKPPEEKTVPVDPNLLPVGFRSVS